MNKHLPEATLQAEPFFLCQHDLRYRTIPNSRKNCVIKCIPTNCIFHGLRLLYQHCKQAIGLMYQFILLALSCWAYLDFILNRALIVVANNVCNTFLRYYWLKENDKIPWSFRLAFVNFADMVSFMTEHGCFILHFSDLWQCNPASPSPCVILWVHCRMYFSLLILLPIKYSFSVTETVHLNWIYIFLCNFYII